MEKILIKNGKVFDGENLKSADVFVVNGVVKKIEKDINENADFIFDASDKFVLPGLIDLHVHLKGFAWGDFGVDANDCSFPFGATAVNDAGSIYGDKNLLKTFKVKSTVFVNSTIKNNRANIFEIENLLEKYDECAVGIKVYFDTTISEVTDVTPLKEICEFARKRDLKVMVHSTNSPTSMIEIVETLSSGNILTHIYHGGDNNCAEDDFLALKVAKQKGVVLDTGFAGHIHTDFGVLKSAFENGFLPDTISSDITSFSIHKRGGDYGITMCMSFAKYLGMSDIDVFKAVTTTPAKVLNKQNEWGALKIGNQADVCVLEFTDEGFDLIDESGNQLKSEKGYRCVLTVLDGQVVYKY